MKKLLLLLIGVFTFSSLSAQDLITVKGVVMGEDNQSQPGASVAEKGTTNGVIADVNGNYQIKVKPDAILVISFLGFKTTEIKVNNRTAIDVKLEDNKTLLNEVVVVGYGQEIQRKDLTGAISSLKGEEIAKIPVQSVAQALQGRIAGMQVAMPDGTPGSEPSIKIRGGSSISQSNEPLYVVDGVPQTDGLAFLDPMDIESVDVLKDASSTAIYGARGANGVVLITTKQIKEGKVRINYDGYVGAKKITSEIPVLNPYEYVLLQYEAALGDAQRETRFTNNYGTFDELESLYGNRPGKNWQREIFGATVLNQYHKFSINGGGKETKFNIFYSRNDDEGVMKESGSTKNIAKLTVNHRVSKKFSVNAIVNYSNQTITGLGTQEGGNTRLSMLQTLLRYRPTIGKNGDDNTLLDLDLDPLDPNLNSPAFQSPLITVQTHKRDYTLRTLNANVSLQYEIAKHLTYRGLASYTDNGRKDKRFNEGRSVTAIRAGGPFGSITQNIYNRFNYNNVITYANTFNKSHKVDFTLGQEYIYNYSEGFGTSASVFPFKNLGWDRMQLGTVYGQPSSFAEDDALLSFFGRANYAYKGKYLLTGSLRYDGSTKFGENNRWGLFPSVALAWRAIQEDFMKDQNIFSDLKLRLSYGEAGNNRIANYAALGVFSTGSYPLDENVAITAYQNSLPNPNLKWEAVQSKNVGLDLGFVKQRITLTADWYDNRSKDLLYETRIPASSGFITQIQNIGTTSSRGIEFSLNTINVKNQNFSWSTAFNIAFNRTKVLSLSDGENFLSVRSYGDNFDYILEVGRPVGIMYGYIRDGLYQVDDFDYNTANNTYTLKSGIVSDNVVVQPGYIKFKDISGPDGVPDGTINQYDRTAIGNANPRYAGGISNTFSYKGFDLSVFLNFTVGNDIYNANALNNARLNLDYQNTLSVFNQNRWTTINAAGQRITDPVELAAANEGKTMPSLNGNQTGRLYSDIIEDGSFLRINNVSLGYTLPKKWINTLKIANARVYVTAYNLHVFTNYSGYDPEVNALRNPLTPGVDFSTYPRARSVVGGVNLSF